MSSSLDINALAGWSFPWRVNVYDLGAGSIFNHYTME